MYLRILFAVLLSQTLLAAAQAQEIVNFARDVQPILEARCIECHGPDKAKNDFRVDEEDSMTSYVEAGDVESSSLWTDYLVTDDPDMKMPPPSPSHPDGLSAAELATIKLWIEEGAKYDWKTAAPVAPTPVAATAAQSTMEKLFLLHGMFHPASTHFPIALLSMSMVFLALSFIFGKPLESAAFHCLWVGALTAIPACVMGWAYAAHEGYGNPFSLNFMDSGIDRHRWLGVAVTVFALVMIPVAYSAYKQEGNFRKKMIWFIGCCLVAMATGAVGFQGGELVYGEGHYLKEYDRMFPAAQPTAETEQTAAAANTVAKQD
ncbi:cytochrome C [Blastopirellula sp. JC732]|uniref:Cytochrome C n=1 Tax=Blastopirellula sediminis TaxID=2894196 RepID=A0A9X1SKH0_9BACT|nr:c-type cytochrome domain-containing protein [Blastopirellula sediminis]MCC9606961.1 cytochrome C [Blastopirellula sediminis]MCC9629744.1 cytochrome C [Blastopirellula sediminis]